MIGPFQGRKIARHGTGDGNWLRGLGDEVADFDRQISVAPTRRAAG
jgi:hypothetical protein